MYFNLGGSEIDAAVQSESAFRSKHTGAELRRVKVNLTIDTEADEDVLSGILAGEEPQFDSTDGHGRVLARWRIVDRSHQQTIAGGRSMYHHSLELEQVEALKPTRLVAGDLALEPYWYFEEFLDDVLSVEAKVTMPEPQFDELKKLLLGKHYFPVVREGISSEAREMRFGRTTWSSHEGTVKVRLMLVDKSFDDPKRPSDDVIVEELARLRANVDSFVRYSELLEELLRTLIHEEVLSEREASELRERASERAKERIIELGRVEDIDDPRTRYVN